MKNLIIEAAIAIAEAKKHTASPFTPTWYEVNEQFQMHTSDRRYKVWFSACRNDCSGFWRVGKHEFMLEFMNGYVYVRPMNDADVYQKKPCYELRPCGNGAYGVHWQSEVLI
jgi:hypothetical protein